MGATGSRQYAHSLLIASAVALICAAFRKLADSRRKSIAAAGQSTAEEQALPTQSAATAINQQLPSRPTRTPPPVSSDLKGLPPHPMRAPPLVSSDLQGLPPRPTRAPPPVSSDLQGLPPRPTRTPPVPSDLQGLPPRPTRAPPLVSSDLQGLPTPPTRAPPPASSDLQKLPPHPSRPPPKASSQEKQSQVGGLTPRPPQVPPQPARKVSPNAPAANEIELWICLDFEWTCDDGEVRQVRSDNVEIIEFSFAIYDVRAGMVACDGQYYCKNQRTPITPFCTELTGISDETLADAGSLADALGAFEMALQADGRAGRPCCAVTHGCADLELVLPQHCRALGLKVPSVLEKYVDLRLAAQRHVSSTGAEGVRAQTLKQICNALGVQMIGSEHCGLDDSYMVMLATQQLLLLGADLEPVDFVRERRDFLDGQILDQKLCLDGLPFLAAAPELKPWLEQHCRLDLPDDCLSVVLGMDGRPCGRAVVDFGSHEVAAQALDALDGGRVFVCGSTPSTHCERLLLARPLRRDEQELSFNSSWVPGSTGLASRPMLAPFPTDTALLLRSTRSRGICFDFQKGCCSRGDSCRYYHEALPQQPCFKYRNGNCTRGADCRYSHEDVISR